MARRMISGAFALAWMGSGGLQGAPTAELQRPVDAVIERAVAAGLVAGAVVAVGNRDGVMVTKAYGRRWSDSSAEALDPRAVFDLASLTKVVATAPSVIKLAAEGRVGLGDPLRTWFPEVEGTGAGEVEVKELLSHSSGFRDLDLPVVRPLEAALRGIAEQGKRGLARGKFRYADINFILLGELVRRVAGVPLNRYATDSFYSPLGMADTGFLPVADALRRCVPTAGTGGRVSVGQVQDPLAQRFGGVAGHAGVFGTADDLSRFARMILSLGELEGIRVLPETAVRLMIAPRPTGGGVLRSLGWDVSSPYSAPRTEAFTGGSFGHTGYTGVSIWIDPRLDRFVVLLSSRLEYRRTREFNRLRRDLSAAAAEMVAARRVWLGTPMAQGR